MAQSRYTLVLTILSLDMKIRANIAVELRDNIEPLCSGASYPIFLSKLWPVFKNILSGEPVFTNLSLEQVSCDCFVCTCLTASPGLRLTIGGMG